MEPEITELLKEGEFEIGFFEDVEMLYIQYTLYWKNEVAGVRGGEPFTEYFPTFNKKTLDLIQKWWDIKDISIVELQEPHQENPEDHFYIELTEKGQRLQFIQQMEDIFKLGCTLIIRPSETGGCNIFLEFQGDIIPKKTIELVEATWDIVSMRVFRIIDESETPVLELKEKTKTSISMRKE